MSKERDILEPMTIDDLAILTAQGFAELREDFNARFTRREDKVDAIRSDLNASLYDAGKLKKRVENLEVHSFGSIQAA